MTRRATVLLLVTAASLLPAEVIDRTVAVVVREAILESEVEMQARLEAMTSGAEYIDSPQVREEALLRLIDQRLIAADIRLTGLQPMSAQERSEALAQLKNQTFGGLNFEIALQKYGVSEEQALDFFVRQVEFTRYVDFRFRTGQTVSDEALQERYTSKYGRVPRRDTPPLAQVRAELRREILDERVDRLLDQHIRQLRADNRVVRLEPMDRSETVEQGGAR